MQEYNFYEALRLCYLPEQRPDTPRRRWRRSKDGRWRLRQDFGGDGARFNRPDRACLYRNGVAVAHYRRRSTRMWRCTPEIYEHGYGAA